jgi:hypothetical protein
MRYLGMAVGGLMLSCSGCVVHQPVPVAIPAPASEAAPAPAAQNCREFQNTVIVGGVRQQAYGTTCQQPDGSWKIASSQAASEAPAAATAPYPVYPAYPAYPAYPYPYYGYPYGYPYYGPRIGVGVGLRFGGRWH